MGTSAWITTTIDRPKFDDEMRTVTWTHIIPGLYAPNGTMQSAGGVYNWLKNTICKMEAYEAKIVVPSLLEEAGSMGVAVTGVYPICFTNVIAH